MEIRHICDPRAAPMAVPAAAMWTGCLLGELPATPALAAAGLVGAGVALGRRAGAILVALALGLGAGMLADRGAGELYQLDSWRPVEAVGIVTSHARAGGDEISLRLRLALLRQGNRMLTDAGELLVLLPPADATSTPAFGSRLRLRGYLGRSPGQANVPSRPPGPWRLRVPSRRFVLVEASPKGLHRLAASIRAKVSAALGGASRSPGRELAFGLLLGERAALPKAWRQGLRRAGLAHILAVSGLHVGILATGIWLLASHVPPLWRFVPVILGVASYAALIGPRPSVARAALSAGVVLVGLTIERPPQPLNALALCLAALLIWQPALVGDLGLQLSAAATAGIALLAPGLAQRWRALAPLLRAGLSVSVAAQVATLPLITPLVGGIQPLAPVLGLVVVPWLGLFLSLAFIWVVPLAAGFEIAPIAAVLDGLAAPCGWLAALPAGPWFLYPLPDASWAGTWLAGIVGLWIVGRPRLALAGFAVVLIGSAPPPPEPTELVVLDVGQGDAILVRGGGEAVLVDGGGWPDGDLGGRVTLPVLAAAGIDRLRAVVLTHPDRDHCEGLVDVARYLPVDELWSAPGWSNDCFQRLLAAIGRWRPLWHADEVAVGPWRLRVLHPAAGSRTAGNDRSLVLRGAIGQRSVLLPGDLEAAGERRLHATGAELRAEVLKVGHHGSRGSSTQLFLDSVGPRWAVVSAGRNNPYGHPAPEALERLRSAGARVLRTDRHGMIRLVPMAARWRVELPAPPREAAAGRVTR